MTTRPLRVGIVCDYLEENWPSMDLVGEMLLRALQEAHADDVHARLLRPTMPLRLTRLPFVGGGGLARNGDRLIARFLDYPEWLRHHREDLDVYHIVDHSYAHLVHALPADRTVVTCHDLDTFRSVLDPAAEPRGIAFRAMTGRILSGLRRAAWVTCDSVATRNAILAHGVVPPERLELAHLGIDATMRPEADPAADELISGLVGPPPPSRIELLHVGSTIPRKRIDVLIRTFAETRKEFPDARLLRVGGAFTPEQAELCRRLVPDPSAVVVLPRLTREAVAAVYRRSTVVLQPSDAEGFGFPVVEAMACGVPVIASDLPVLREVGGAAAEYCPVGDVAAWSAAVASLLRERRDFPLRFAQRRQSAIRHSAQFSWSRFARTAVRAYRHVLGGPHRGAASAS